MRADLIAAGLHSGWMAVRRATIADIWGHAMDVPEANLKLNGERSSSKAPDGWAIGAPDHEARIVNPRSSNIRLHDIYTTF